VPFFLFTGVSSHRYQNCSDHYCFLSIFVVAAFDSLLLLLVSEEKLVLLLLLQSILAFVSQRLRAATALTKSTKSPTSLSAAANDRYDSGFSS
jgi:hypothetical protein